MFNDTALNNLRKSLEITLTFFIILIISVLFFVVAASSQATSQINENATLQQNATPYQVAKSLYNLEESQYRSEVSFWRTFFNSIGFLFLIIPLSFAWVFVVTSYLVESSTKQFYLLCVTTLFIAFSLAGALSILSTYANYYSAKLLLIISIVVEIWFIFTYGKIFLLMWKYK